MLARRRAGQISRDFQAGVRHEAEKLMRERMNEQEVADPGRDRAEATGETG